MVGFYNPKRLKATYSATKARVFQSGPAKDRGKHPSIIENYGLPPASPNALCAVNPIHE